MTYMCYHSNRDPADRISLPLTVWQYPTRVNHSIFSELFRIILFQNNVTVLNLTTDMLPFEPRTADPNLFSNYPVASDLGVQPFERLELNWLIRPLKNNAGSWFSWQMFLLEPSSADPDLSSITVRQHPIWVNHSIFCELY